MMFTESIEAYQNILAVDANYFPALHGCAEAQFGLAKKYLKQRLVGRSHVHVQKSVDFIVQ